jgi:hypothetical protein
MQNLTYVYDGATKREWFEVKDEDGKTINEAHQIPLGGFLQCLPIADPGEGGGSRLGGSFKVNAGYEEDTIDFYDGEQWLGRVVVEHRDPTLVKAFIPDF